MGVDFSCYTEKDKLHKEEEWKRGVYGNDYESVYIRESYHGVTHAVNVFCPESYECSDFVSVSASVLRKRMTKVEKACWQRSEDYGKLEPDLTEYALQQIGLFWQCVALATHEEAAGRRVWFYNSY